MTGMWRVAVYYGDKARLEPMKSRGWLDAEPPILAQTDHASYATQVLNRLAFGKRVYIRDCAKPSDEDDEAVVTLVPNAYKFRTAALFPMLAATSMSDAKDGDGRLLGALLLQHRDADALHEESEREYLSLLCNMLAAGHVAAAALHTSAGGGHAGRA